MANSTRKRTQVHDQMMLTRGMSASSQSMISTLDEVMKIQEDGRQKRAAAEVELVQLENDIKKKMLELSAGGQH